MQAIKETRITFSQLNQAILVLSSNGTLSAVQDETATTKAKKYTEKLNTHLMLKVRSHKDLTFLASPVTGGGVAVGRFQQLFLLANQQGKKKPEDWAVFVEQIFASQGEKIIKEGKPLETSEQQLAELTSQANEFANKQLPILKALQIV